jgi:hypothetical protein
LNLSKAVYQKYSLLILVGIIIGLGLHLGLIVMDSMMEEKPIYFNLDKKFFQSVFSFPFLPILIIEIFFSSLTLYLWFSLRHAAKKAYELDVKNEKYKTTVDTFQKIMTLMAEHIIVNNNRILGKIEIRRRQGQEPSKTIETASQNIAKILGVLSEVSFVEPYLASNKNDPIDLLKELNIRIEKIIQENLD